MRLTPEQRAALRPLARWLMDYIDEHGITLTELARLAGLSGGALRTLVILPERTPAVETCLRLARATHTPAAEIFQLAKLPYADETTVELDPDRAALFQAYDRLTKPASRQLLIRMAQMLKTLDAG
jgi:transcriptional regulator with XRE-family HTH domain